MEPRADKKKKKKEGKKERKALPFYAEQSVFELSETSCCTLQRIIVLLNTFNILYVIKLLLEIM
jgi:hypothetical protein